MVNLDALNWFDSFIKILKKSIGLYQPCDFTPDAGGNIVWFPSVQMQPLDHSMRHQ